MTLKDILPNISDYLLPDRTIIAEIISPNTGPRCVVIISKNNMIYFDRFKKKPICTGTDGILSKDYNVLQLISTEDYNLVNQILQGNEVLTFNWSICESIPISQKSENSATDAISKYGLV